MHSSHLYFNNTMKMMIFDDVFLIVFDRGSKLDQLVYATLPGIYLLYSEDKVYVGQNSSTTGVISRIKRHDKTKDWWTKGIIFGFKSNQKVTKSQADYLERIILERFTSIGIPIDNKTKGNTSPINPSEKAEAESLLAIARKLLGLLNQDLFALPQYKYTLQIGNMTYYGTETEVINQVTGLLYDEYQLIVEPDSLETLQLILDEEGIPHQLQYV